MLQEIKEGENQNEETKNKKIKSFNIKDILESNLSLLALSNLQKPYIYDDIFNKVDKNELLIALNDELLNMKNLNVYEFVKSIPKNTNLVSAKWVFRNKYNSDNTINTRKARLVERGFTQKQGIDYDKTFSPTLKSKSLRLVDALAVQHNFNIYQIDIKVEYLNAKLDEDIYMEVPEGVEGYRKGYWKLKKALYGLKQSGRLWNKTLDSELNKIRLIRLKSEPCHVFIIRKIKMTS